MAASLSFSSRFGVSIALLAFVLATGCGRRPDLPPMAKVSGTVTLDGQPLSYGMVQFVPDASQGTEGPPGVGRIDEKGRFTITTAGEKGAVVGHHRIRVKSEEPFNEEALSVGQTLLPERYNDHKISGLTTEVKAGEKNQVTLKLSSAPSSAQGKRRLP